MDKICNEWEEEKWVEEKGEDIMCVKNCGDTKEQIKEVENSIRDMVDLRAELKEMAEYDEAAKGLKKVYDSFVRAGFSPELSGQMLLAYISKDM